MDMLKVDRRQLSGRVGMPRREERLHSKLRRRRRLRNGGGWLRRPCGWMGGRRRRTGSRKVSERVDDKDKDLADGS